MQYETDRNLIKPFFDEKFYLNRYGDAVKKSGLKPIDHFLKKGWYSNNWKSHTDPNSWFNTTLHKERLWGKLQNNHRPSPINPFVDFLSQPKLNHHRKNIEVWARKDEANRAWLAIEGLMRLDRFNIILNISSGVNLEELVRFVPQVKRGLKLLLDNKTNKSFYHSDFIRNPDKYKLTNLLPQKKITYPMPISSDLKKDLSKYNSKSQKPHCWPKPVTYIKQDISYLMHRIYAYTNWKDIGIINPTMINIAHCCDEPLALTSFSNKLESILTMLLKIITIKKLHITEHRIQDFKDYLVRIADGFDLCMVGAKLPIKNLKIVPGYMNTWINEKELSKNKEFSISFLLTKRHIVGSKWNYKLRNELWKREKDIKIPTKFYISYRDASRFPKSFYYKTLPTYSKKWIFNSQFNIAIENTKQDYYFTEKILDCFIALTIPIYIGCPNISNYFDHRGIIIVQSLDELIKVANSLTPETYASMLPYLKENRKRALKLLNLEKEIITKFGEKIR